MEDTDPGSIANRSVDQAVALLQRCCFRIRIEKEADGDEEPWYFGTGFFVTRQGHALTAFHNLPRGVREDEFDEVSAFYRNLAEPLMLRYRADLSDEDADIAVLQLPEPERVVFDPLDLAVIPDMAERERKEAWRRRPSLYVFGFPVRAALREGTLRTTQADHLIEGRIARQVMGYVAEYCQSAERRFTVKRLYIDSDRVEALEGISGGPVIDTATGWAIAVQGSYHREAGVVYASELLEVAATWKMNQEVPLLRALHELRPAPREQPKVVGPGGSDLEHWNRVRQELDSLFPTAEAIIVRDSFRDRSRDQDAGVYLGVEVQQADGYDAHLIKLGRRDLVSKDYEGFQQCLQRRPFAARTLVRVTRHDLGDHRMGVVYENAYRLQGDPVDGRDALRLDRVARDSVLLGDPDPTSVTRVIRQVYSDLRRCLYPDARPDRESAREYYPHQLNESWLRWTEDDRRLELRRNLIWLVCGRDAADREDPADYLDACDFVRWALTNSGRLPHTLVGPAHGSLTGDTILVSVERGEAEFPKVVGYEAMGPDNVPVWDFVSLETSLKVRLLLQLHADTEVRQAVSPHSDAPEAQRKYLHPDRPPVTIDGRVFHPGLVAFALAFEGMLADPALRTVADGAGFTGNARLDRGLMIILQIRAEAATCLNGNAGAWDGQYDFALAACGILAASDTEDVQQMSVALVSAGVAAARLESKTRTIQAMLASPQCPPGPYPSYHPPMFHSYRLWKQREELEKARDIIGVVRDDFRHAIPLVREYALMCAALEDSDTARRIIEPLVPYCRHFGDHETLMRFARACRDKGNEAWHRNQLPAADFWSRDHPAKHWYQSAYNAYREAFDFSGHYYPGVCTAQLAATLGLDQDARAAADRVLQVCGEIDVATIPQGERFWVFDTKGCTSLIVDDTDGAVNYYQEALRLVTPDIAGLAKTAYDGVCRMHWCLGAERVRPVAEVFWNSGIDLSPGPSGDCGRRAASLIETMRRKAEAPPPPA